MSIDRLALDVLPPAINQTAGKGSHWGWAKAKAAFEAEVALAVAGQKIETLYGHVRLDVVIADGRADIDSRIKALLDALTVIGVYEDDRQVVDLRVLRVPRVAMEAAVLVTWARCGVIDTPELEGWWGATLKAPEKKKARRP